MHGGNRLFVAYSKLSYSIVSKRTVLRYHNTKNSITPPNKNLYNHIPCFHIPVLATLLGLILAWPVDEKPLPTAIPFIPAEKSHPLQIGAWPCFLSSVLNVIHLKTKHPETKSQTHPTRCLTARRMSMRPQDELAYFFVIFTRVSTYQEP